MNGETSISVVAVVASLVGAYVAWRKWRPETDDITVTTAGRVNSMTLEFAKEVNDDNADLRREIGELRAEFRQYRHDADARMAELTVELRDKRAQVQALSTEKHRLEGENQRLRSIESEAGDLRRRVALLEEEVRQLRSGRNP